jgi:hypothetical protein
MNAFRDELNGKKNNLYNEMRSDETARRMVDEADVFARQVSPEHFDAAMCDAFSQQQDPMASVFLKTSRLMLKHVLPRMKRCFNGGQVLMPFFEFALDRATYECFACMLTPALQYDVCFRLRIYRVVDENCFVCACNPATALHIFACDLEMSARHGVQAPVDTAAGHTDLHFERPTEQHARLYEAVLKRQAEQMQESIRKLGIRGVDKLFTSTATTAADFGSAAAAPAPAAPVSTTTPLPVSKKENE